MGSEGLPRNQWDGILGSLGSEISNETGERIRGRIIRGLMGPDRSLDLFWMWWNALENVPWFDLSFWNSIALLDRQYIVSRWERKQEMPKGSPDMMMIGMGRNGKAGMETRINFRIHPVQPTQTADRAGCCMWKKVIKDELRVLGLSSWMMVMLILTEMKHNGARRNLQSWG